MVIKRCVPRGTRERDSPYTLAVLCYTLSGRRLDPRPLKRWFYAQYFCRPQQLTRPFGWRPVSFYCLSRTELRVRRIPRFHMSGGPT